LEVTIDFKSRCKAGFLFLYLYHYSIFAVQEFMVQFTATIKQFGQMGEKTGWSYIEIPQDIAEQLKPGNKKSFTVKGKLDNYSFNAVALLPMGSGSFIMALKAEVRKKIGKRKGAMLKVQMEEDKKGYELNKEMRDCLNDEPRASVAFQKMPRSHQNYFSKWVESAKTEPTKAKRIAMVITAMLKGQNYAEMIRENKGKKDPF
jgi:hypothetical protein